MPEYIDYRGYRLLVSPVGKGWRATIYAQGSQTALPDSPVMLEKSSKEEIVAGAKGIIDARSVRKNDNPIVRHAGAAGRSGQQR